MFQIWQKVYSYYSHTSNTFILKTTNSALYILFTILNLCVPRILQMLTTNNQQMYQVFNT